MKVLMFEQNFEDVISGIAGMTSKQLEEHLDNILGIGRLQLLGVLKEEITNENTSNLTHDNIMNKKRMRDDDDDDDAVVSSRSQKLK